VLRWKEPCGGPAGAATDPHDRSLGALAFHLEPVVGAEPGTAGSKVLSDLLEGRVGPLVAVGGLRFASVETVFDVARGGDEFADLAAVRSAFVRPTSADRPRSKSNARILRPIVAGKRCGTRRTDSRPRSARADRTILLGVPDDRRNVDRGLAQVNGQIGDLFDFFPMYTVIY